MTREQILARLAQLAEMLRQLERKPDDKKETRH